MSAWSGEDKPMKQSPTAASRRLFGRRLLEERDAASVNDPDKVKCVMRERMEEVEDDMVRIEFYIQLSRKRACWQGKNCLDTKKSGGKSPHHPFRKVENTRENCFLACLHATGQADFLLGRDD